MNRRTWIALGAVSGVFGGHLVVGAAVAQHDAARTDHAQATPATIATVRRGKTVQLSGTVVRVLDRDEFRLSDGTGSIPVRLTWTGPSPVAVGDVVRVEGLVVDEMTFGLSRPEVLARSLRLANNAVVYFDAPLPAPAESSRSADSGPATPDIVPIGRLARGQAATISGRVTGIVDVDEFRVEDGSGSVRVYVGWQNRVGLSVGDDVTISGTLDDEPWPIPVEFYADALTLPDGRAIDLRAVTSREYPPASQPQHPTAQSPQKSPAVTSRIADIRPYDIVRLQGTVDRITDEDEFRLRDESASIGVYIGWRNAMPVKAGDRVSVIGIVDADGPAGLLREVYAHELTTADGTRVELQPWRDAPEHAQIAPSTPAPTATPPARIADAPVTPIDSVRRGQAVTLRGEVRRIRDTDEFVLRDDTGTITIYIGWRNRMPVSVGDRVTVIGTADDDVFPGMRPEIYATRIVLPDGRTLELGRGTRDDRD